MPCPRLLSLLLLPLLLVAPRPAKCDSYTSDDGTINCLETGTSYSNISNDDWRWVNQTTGDIYSSLIRGGTRETEDGHAVPTDAYSVTFWDSHNYSHPSWIEYSAPLVAGNWRIGLNVENFEWGSGKQVPLAYAFQISYQNAPGTSPSFGDGGSFLDDDDHDSPGITGSDTTPFYGYFCLSLASAAQVTVHYRWENDASYWANGTNYDSNLEIRSAFFDRQDDDHGGNLPVPEPATLLSLGSGLALLLARRRRRSRAR